MARTIQVDMYAVGLGAGLLLQFRPGRGAPVRVLADAGMAPGYPAEGVHDRLPQAFAAFGNAADAPRRLDLVIGTHYDADHLKGLVPIARDEGIALGEVWLPPIRDDAPAPHAPHAAHAGPHDFLPQRLFDDPGHAVLLAHLQRRRAEIETLQAAEQASVAATRHTRGASAALPHYRAPAADAPHVQRLQRASQAPHGVAGLLEFFEAQHDDAARRTGGDAHATATYDSDTADAHALAQALQQAHPLPPGVQRTLRADDLHSPALPAALASLRKATAADAITASHLDLLVKALRARATPVRPQCRVVADGTPQRFAWSPAQQRFVPTTRTAALGLTLLAPSQSLVDKHADKLPVGTYAQAIARAPLPIALKGITESNQLSYVVALQCAGQRLLVSGDAGCYGFKDGQGRYWPQLLAALAPLQVVQVAHHGGMNYDFYNALLAAGLDAQAPGPFLLLSHEVHDTTRPSPPFGDFMAQLKGEPTLLFTSQPDADKVQAYRARIAPVAGGSAAERGDLQLAFAPGAGGWSVLRHCVRVAAA